MTEPVPSDPLVTRSSLLKRYGPVTAVVVAIALVAVLATVGGEDRTTTAAEGLEGGRPSENPDLPITYREAVTQQTVDQYDFGDCDFKTGRIKMPSVYAPPCLAATSDKGVGQDTAIGVTGDTIKVVYYIPPENAGISSLMQQFLDPRELQQETLLRYVDLYNDVYNLWGRQIEIVPYQASGMDDDIEAARADALKVAKDIKPFASIGGPNLTPAYADELARNGILCIGCGLAVPDTYFQDNAPYLWGSAATPEQFLINVGDYIVNRLVGRNAEHAGQPEFQGRTRTFGVVRFEQDPPVFSDLVSVVSKEGRKRGFEPVVNESYILDLPKLPERAATIVAKLKQAQVTTVVFLGDPIMPIYLTQAATAQSYFPEWIVTGTVLTDTTTLGRIYDQEQWAHAFGLSTLPARRPYAQQEPFRLYEWYWGEPPAAAKTAALLYNNISVLALGIHMAGPDLTAETFRGGMFKYPPSGGGPTTPHISYGNYGYFVNPDYLGVDDVTEIWWDAEATGPNEQNVEGQGMWRYSNGGKRYLPGQMPLTEPDAFELEGSVTVYPEPPPEDVVPSYPSPRDGG